LRKKPRASPDQVNAVSGETIPKDELTNGPRHVGFLPYKRHPRPDLQQTAGHQSDSARKFLFPAKQLPGKPPGHTTTICAPPEDAPRSGFPVVQFFSFSAGPDIRPRNPEFSRSTPAPSVKFTGIEPARKLF